MCKEGFERGCKVRGYSGRQGDELKDQDSSKVTWGCREYVECGGVEVRLVSNFCLEKGGFLRNQSAAR